MGEMGDHWRDLKEHKKAQKAKHAAREAANAEAAGVAEEGGGDVAQKPQEVAITKQPTEAENREKRKRRKRSQIEKTNKPANQPERRRCWDWVVSSGNVHYAKNRSSFKSYRHINLEGQTLNGITRIIGIGMVVLKAKLPESDEISELVLRNVLHVPDALCNGFSPGLLGSSYTMVENTAIGSDENGAALWHAEEFYGLSKLVLEGNPQGESPLAAAEQNDKLGFNLSLSLEERNTIRLPHRPKSPITAKHDLESPTMLNKAANITKEPPIEDVLRRTNDSDGEWVIDDYDSDGSDGSEQEGTKVGHPYFAKWLQEMTAESMVNASKFACSPEVLLNATAKGICAVTEIYKSAKPDLLQVGKLEETIAKEAFKSAFDLDMYQALKLSLPAK